VSFSFNEILVLQHKNKTKESKYLRKYTNLLKKNLTSVIRKKFIGENDL